MTYCMVLFIHNSGIPELLWTYPNLATCMAAAQEIQGACVSLKTLAMFN